MNAPCVCCLWNCLYIDCQFSFRSASFNDTIKIRNERCLKTRKWTRNTLIKFNTFRVLVKKKGALTTRLSTPRYIKLVLRLRGITASNLEMIWRCPELKALTWLIWLTIVRNPHIVWTRTSPNIFQSILKNKSVCNGGRSRQCARLGASTTRARLSVVPVWLCMSEMTSGNYRSQTHITISLVYVTLTFKKFL